MKSKSILPFASLVFIFFILAMPLQYTAFAEISDMSAQVSLPAASEIAGGGTHSVFLNSSGYVYTFGDNEYGQLGNGSPASAATSSQVKDISGIKSISAGLGHTIALLNNGTVLAWGYNFSGQLGDRTDVDRNSPVQVSSLTDVKSVAAGGLHTLALKNDGTVWAWGDNTYGQLGDGTTSTRFYPIQVSGLENITAISAGDNHSLALDSSGNIWSWGYNANGQLGNGTNENSSIPVAISSISVVKMIFAGGCHSIAVLGDGTVYSWGANSYGQLGDGTTVSNSLPSQITGLSGIVSAAAGEYHSLFLNSDGILYSCGSNINCQIGEGYGTRQLSPVRINGITNILSIAAGGYHSLALDSSNTLWAWGWNFYGQLGDGTTTNRSLPVKVQMPQNNAPVLDDIGNRTVDEGQLLKFTVSASDADSNTLTYSTGVLPEGASFDPATATFSWTPDYNQAATYFPIHFEVSDGTLTGSQDIMITVNNINQSPVANAGFDQTVSADSSDYALVELDGTSSFDPDGDNLVYTWTGPFGTVSGEKVSVKIPVGENSVTLTVSDGVLESVDDVKIIANKLSSTVTTVNNGFLIGSCFTSTQSPGHFGIDRSYFRFFVISNNKQFLGSILFYNYSRNLMFKSEQINFISIEKDNFQLTCTGTVQNRPGKYTVSLSCKKGFYGDKLSIKITSLDKDTAIYEAENKSITNGYAHIKVF